MLKVLPKGDWQLMLDFTFITNHLPENTPVIFRTKHTKGFLQLLHPAALLSDDVLFCMEMESSKTPICSEQYAEKLELYYAASGVALHHLLIAPQETCTVCGFSSKPEAQRSRTILVYSALGAEPCHGTIMPSRCANRKCCHRGNYGWDIIPAESNTGRIFKPLKNRHSLPYWVCSTQTAFLTTMISKDVLSQVLWNHAACLNMVN